MVLASYRIMRANIEKGMEGMRKGGREVILLVYYSWATAYFTWLLSVEDATAWYGVHEAFASKNNKNVDNDDGN